MIWSPLANTILHNDPIKGRNTAHYMDVSTSETDHIPLLSWIEARECIQIKPGGTKVQPSIQIADQNIRKSYLEVHSGTQSQ